jgi:asparagine synthase (glutamine-hydrolysing)
VSAIAGIVSLDGAPVGTARLDRMVEAIRFLKTDRVGVWRSDEAGLAHLGFATTPQSVNETQPALAEPAGAAIVFDGRLDNRSDLLRELRARELNQDSPDSQIVQALFARHGTDCPRHLVGDYAFAVWQRRERRLFCARSPLGWRPLLWYRSASVFAFATEVKALVDGLPVARRPNEGALAELLSLRFVTPTETLWRDVYRLPPGAALEVADGAVRCWHWHTGPFPELSGSPDELAERFLALFDDALGSSTRSCTAVAAQLSGGLDSSSIVCRATELHRAGRIDRQIRPVSVHFPDEPDDESVFSNAVTELTGIEAMIAGARPFSWDRAREWCADTLHLPVRPNVTSVIVPTLARARDEGMRVVLTGEGGDDWLTGSSSHWPDLVRRAQLTRLWREAITQAPGPLPARLRALVAVGALPLVSPQRRARVERPSLDFSLVPPAWIRPEWAASVDLPARWRSDVSPVKLRSFAQRARFARYTLARPHVNVDNLLALAARTGVELRHPFHDLRLTEFLMGVPADMLRRNGQTKFLLRRAMCGSLPEVVRTRRTKAAFSRTVLRALEQLLVTTQVGDLHPVRMGWVQATGFEQTVAQWRTWFGSDRLGPKPTGNLAPVWFTASVHLWLEHAVGV